jgi:UrcA family protein
MSAIRIIIASALITGAALKAVPAFAEPAVEANVSIVRTADLDLTSDSGRRALDHRLVVAAYDVCGSASDADLAGKNKARACRADVLAKARAEGAQLASRNGRDAIKLAVR